MVPAETLVGLQNLLVHLRDVSAENAHVYQYRLWDAKRVKVETAQNRGVPPDGAAGYRDGLRRATNGHPLSAEEGGGRERLSDGAGGQRRPAAVTAGPAAAAGRRSAARLGSTSWYVTGSGTVPAETLVGLQNLLVHLRDVSAENAHVYQYRLWDAKRVKVETAQNRGVSPDGAAGYRTLGRGVVAVNACRTAPEGSAGRVLSLLDQLRLPDAGALPDWGLHPAETLVGLQNLLVHLRDVSAENAHVYQYRLWDAKRVKVETAQNRGVPPDGAAGYRDGLRRATNGHPLSAEEGGGRERLSDGAGGQRRPAAVTAGPAAAARTPERCPTGVYILVCYWERHGVCWVLLTVPAETLVGLQNLLVHLRDVSAENAHVYQYRLWDAKRVKVETAQNRGVSPDGAAGYRDRLRRTTNGHPLSAEEVQKVVSRVNQLS
ncbi:hypothetical protein FJT64_021959 [Amphibalanus amphitrite]|uniref:Uncharacterized protein n=1 Tax=Amphibalanus amphitrite TaxID=1232801 RepID=A0A6A4WKA8_AMPAM|nr:hypothetical protein FJT64_021959 [Amphibalanus amphitrite]